MARLLLAGMNAEMLALARELGHEVVAVADPAARRRTWRDLPLYTSDDEAATAGGFEAVAVAIDDPIARERVQQFYAGHGLPAAALIAGRVSPEARLGRGCVAQHGSHVSVGCRLGDGVRLNVGANVMHDTGLGDYVTIAPNAVLLGHVVVGRLSYIGANATVLPRVRIGAGCIIGAGAVVTRPVADGAVVKGNPAA